MNILEGRILYEAGQTLVVAACRDRREFLRHRESIRQFAERMGADLDQQQVFVLAFPSNSFLIELKAPRKPRIRKAR